MHKSTLFDVVSRASEAPWLAVAYGNGICVHNLGNNDRFPLTVANDRHRNAISSLAITHDAGLIAFTRSDEGLIVWDRKAKRELHHFRTTLDLKSVHFGPDAKWVAAADCSEVKLWYLAAADMDVHSFQTVIAPHMERISRRVTVYFSRTDKALKLSKPLHPGSRRLGLTGPLESTLSNVDVLDASALTLNPLSLDHSYHRTVPLVIPDVNAVFNGELPETRGLFRMPVTATSSHFWSFKKSMAAKIDAN